MLENMKCVSFEDLNINVVSEFNPTSYVISLMLEMIVICVNFSLFSYFANGFLSFCFKLITVPILH